MRQGVDGCWRADWPEREDYDIGPPGIAWITWHLDFWWSMALDHSFGRGTLSREQIAWPGTAHGVRGRLADLSTAWSSALARLADDDLRTDEHTQWPFRSRPFEDVIAWVNGERTKNAAEIGHARCCYPARSG